VQGGHLVRCCAAAAALLSGGVALRCAAELRCRTSVRIP
jgi:hypothetical protein